MGARSAKNTEDRIRYSVGLTIQNFEFADFKIRV